MISHYLEPLQDFSGEKIPDYDFHMHTTWTDGEDTVQAMHVRAIQAGLKGVLFSEHARRTSGEWFGRFAAEIRALPKTKCIALVGVESKIDDFSGALDLAPEVFREADLVMASVHRFPGEEGIVKGTKDYTPEKAVDLEYRLSMAALDNPDVDILGHVFGMTYRRFGFHAPEDKFREIIGKAARTGVAIEINPHYHVDPWSILRWCQEAGAPVSLGSNAHSVTDVGKIQRVLRREEAPWKM